MSASAGVPSSAPKYQMTHEIWPLNLAHIARFEDTNRMDVDSTTGEMTRLTHQPSTYERLDRYIRGAFNPVAVEETYRHAKQYVDNAIRKYGKEFPQEVAVIVANWKGCFKENGGHDQLTKKYQKFADDLNRIKIQYTMIQEGITKQPSPEKKRT